MCNVCNLFKKSTGNWFLLSNCSILFDKENLCLKMYRDFGAKNCLHHTGSLLLQCFESGLDPDSIKSVDPDTDPGGQK